MTPNCFDGSLFSTKPTTLVMEGVRMLRNPKQKIAFICALLILVIFTNQQSFSLETLVGTAYSSSISNMRHRATQTLHQMTGAHTIRLNLSWAEADSIFRATGSWRAIADSVVAYVPTNIEPILLLSFWNPMKMDKPENARYTDVYKARDLQEFRYSCYKLAYELRGKVRYFVLHNEPNLFWNPDSGSQNWRNSIEDFAIQCTAAAQAIKQANPDAYIIYGSFAGISHYGNGHENPITKQFCDAIAPEGGNPIIDAIDFHFYGNELEQEQYSEIADSISAYCMRRNVDWIIGETAGPKIDLPTDMPDPHNPNQTIYESLLQAIDNGIRVAIVRDSLVSYTRYYEPENYYLPENWQALEVAKKADFVKKIIAFADTIDAFVPAKIVSWFSAFILPNLPSYQEPIPDSVDAESYFKTFLRTEAYGPMGLVYVDDVGTEYPTPLANLMKQIIYIYFPLGIESLPGNSDTVDQMMQNNYLEQAYLFQNYPNPFNMETRIFYNIPVNSDVRLDIYNMLGELVESQHHGSLSRGLHSVVWDASAVASGTYFYRISIGNQVLTRSMLLLK